MNLSSAHFQELHAALLSAFPSQSDLKLMVKFQLNENLDAVVGGGNMNETVFNLIEWAEAKGRTADLINGASEANGGNPALKTFVENFRAAPPADATPSNSNPIAGDQVRGDKVGGDKVGGDQISLGDISNASGVAVGDGAQVNVTHNYYGTEAAKPGSPTGSGGDSSTSATQSPEVFVSYTWGGDSETIVDQLEAAFADKGITLVRDKSSVNYKDRIRDFMRRLGQGNAVVVIISHGYLESQNCMFELLEIAKHGELIDRIFPIVLSDAEIYDPIKRIRYIKYWEDKTKELDEAMRSVSAANMQGFRESIDLYTAIRETIADLTDTLSDMNVLTPDMHRDNEFSTLIEAVSTKLGKA